jgi:hypothetical protein
MARSLTVNHQETPSVNVLFTAFLVFAAAWLAVAGLALVSDDSAAATTAPAAP